MSNLTSDRLLHRIEHLNEIGIALSAETDTRRLLEIILLGAKELTNADGGSLYILTDRTLNFELIHTTSLDIHMGGTSGKPITFPTVPLDHEDGSPNLNNVVTTAINEQRLINIPDAYQNEHFDFSGTRAFDRKTGYHSQSFLTVPMQDHEGRIIGALQLINAKDVNNGQTVPFSAMDDRLISSLASQAAIAITRKRLIEGLEQLLLSLTRLIANAIDDKSPHTGGHCRRVPAITRAIARAVNADAGEAFGQFTLTPKQQKELEMAAWLHDCGKITTPEYIVDKHTKLETVFDRMHLIDSRLEILRRDAEIALLRARLNSSDNPPTSAALDEHQITVDRLAEIRTFLYQCNTGGLFVGEAERQRLAELARMIIDYQVTGQQLSFLNDDELYNLSVARGTLTDEQRQIINNHIAATLHMLEPLPFPEHLRRIPEIAGGHHERMDGKGYPRGIPAGELPLQARILAIADIFEALTASDRVYRRPNTLSEALTIMARMCKEGHIDQDLFTLFVQQQAYRDYAETSLLPEQRDNVNAESVLAILR